MAGLNVTTDTEPFARQVTKQIIRGVCYLTICCLFVHAALALDPRKGLTQYTRTNWTQADGLPQDAISVIVQTIDGYLWVGTDEGLARFDGYDFTTFNKNTSALPSNSITALALGTDGSLWIGTAKGLAQYSEKRIHSYAVADGFLANPIGGLYVDHAGTLLVVSGGSLSRLEGKKLSVVAARKDIPFELRTVCEDSNHVLWVAGFSGLARWDNGKFISTIDSAALDGNLITSLATDDKGNLWMGGSRGILRRSPDGRVRKFGVRDGMPDVFVRSLTLDRNGTLWAGTNSGLFRLRDDRFDRLPGLDGLDKELVRSLYNDREGDLWVGANSGLSRLRDGIFDVYGKPEGLPGDDPNATYQDHEGRVWVGFHNSGLMLFSPNGYRVFGIRDGLPSNEIFSIRETHDGSLLMGTREGLVKMRGTHFTTYRPTGELGLEQVFDALEDSTGRLWLAMVSGLGEITAGKIRVVLRTDGSSTAVVSLLEGHDGALWAGTYGSGLWRVQGGSPRRFTLRDGLSSNQIRSLYQDPDGTLWIATFDGGLNAFADGHFSHITTKDGLLSDNISNVVDDGKSLWLSTTRGICRIFKKQLRDFMTNKISSVKPTNYGVEDGLRSEQCAPGYPVAGGGSRTADGRLWFPTSRGLAVIDPHVHPPRELPPIAHLVDVTVDEKTVDTSGSLQLRPSIQRIRIRYAGTHLNAPESVRYFYKLEGLDSDWVMAGNRREIDYNTLPHGKYRFLVRAELPSGLGTQADFRFEKLPRFYETAWFGVLFVGALIACTWGAYQMRVRQLRYGFTLVLQERARLAREIHDTLAQGFVGIASQLEAVSTELPEEFQAARRYLDVARKMARHSMTEARRSVSDLRASVLEGQNLAAALLSGAQMWTAGSGVTAKVDTCGAECALPDEYEQHLLRIAQEAITNVLKHAQASTICVTLRKEMGKISLRIVDNGRGFREQHAFSIAGGHFGLIGMRERAERLGGKLLLFSQPGEGTRIEVTVPMP